MPATQKAAPEGGLVIIVLRKVLAGGLCGCRCFHFGRRGAFQKFLGGIRCRLNGFIDGLTCGLSGGFGGCCSLFHRGLGGGFGFCCGCLGGLFRRLGFLSQTGGFGVFRLLAFHFGGGFHGGLFLGGVLFRYIGVSADGDCGDNGSRNNYFHV